MNIFDCWSNKTGHLKNHLGNSDTGMNIFHNFLTFYWQNDYKKDTDQLVQPYFSQRNWPWPQAVWAHLNCPFKKNLPQGAEEGPAGSSGCRREGFVHRQDPDPLHSPVHPQNLQAHRQEDEPIGQPHHLLRLFNPPWQDVKHEGSRTFLIRTAPTRRSLFVFLFEENPVSCGVGLLRPTRAVDC